jgi:hypothetical protein
MLDDLSTTIPENVIEERYILRSRLFVNLIRLDIVLIYGTL